MTKVRGKTVPSLIRTCLRCGELKVGQKTIRISKNRLDMDNKPIKNVGAPTASGDAARKQDVDTIRSNSALPLVVQVVTTDPTSPVVGQVWLRSDLA